MSLIAQKLISASGATEATEDPDFNLVTGLYHFDGTNGAQNKTFLDSSTNGFTVTRQGSTSQGTFTPFSADEGKWSASFDGTDDYLEVASSSDFDYTSSLCVDGWFYMTTAAGTGPNAHAIVNRWAATSGDRGFLIDVESTGLRVIVNQGGSSNVTVCDPGSSGAISLNVWHHFALTWDGTTYRAFLDGALEGSATGNAAPSGNGKVVRIGHNTNVHYFGGYISNVRIVVDGGAIYTSAFTPPITPSTAISGTELLTSCSNRFKDKSTSARTITPSSKPKIQPFSPFAPSAAYDAAVNGGAGYFDGDNDYLTVPDSTDFNFGSGEFTVEAWVYGADGGSATGSVVYNQSVPGAFGDSAVYFGAGTSGVSMYISTNGTSWTGPNRTASVTVDDDAWHHCVWQRRGNLLEIYVDGTQASSTSFSGTIYNSSRNVEIGTQNGGSDFKDYISDLRVVKGSAVYSANFTPPTAPLTAITNTKLLLNFTNAAVFDQTGKSAILTKGNAKLDTSVKKFGTASAKFDGTDDNLTLSNKDLAPVGTQSFTIECFIYVNANKNYNGIYSAGYGIQMYVNSSGKLQCWLGQSGGTFFVNGFQSTTTIPTSTWRHIALVRDSSAGTLTWFVEGLEKGQQTSVTTAIPALATYSHTIGSYESGTYSFNGYIDEFRITNKARYTSNFTAPTEEFFNL